MRILFILFICLGTLLPAQAAPKQEIRASWITTLGGLDWPSQKATSPARIERQKKELGNILDKLQEANRIAISPILTESDFDLIDETITKIISNRNDNYLELSRILNDLKDIGVEIMINSTAVSVEKQKKVRYNGEDVFMNDGEDMR